MYSKDCSSNIQAVPQIEPYNTQQLDETIVVHVDDATWVRHGVEGTTVDVIANDVEDDIEMEDII